jgi:hypothetical protein
MAAERPAATEEASDFCFECNLNYAGGMMLGCREAKRPACAGLFI